MDLSLEEEQQADVVTYVSVPLFLILQLMITKERKLCGGTKSIQNQNH